MTSSGSPHWVPGTLENLISLTPSSSAHDRRDEVFKAGPTINHYSEHVVDDILDQIFEERRGHFPQTSSECKLAKELEIDPDKHLDKRLKYWRQVLDKRQEMQLRLQAATGRKPEEMLINRRSTLDHRNKQTVKRLMDYADRMEPIKLAARQPAWLPGFVDPCTCEYAEDVCETLPQAEKDGYKDVEIIGLPSLAQKEILGAEATPLEPEHSWLKSRVLDQRIEERFADIRGVLEHFPDLQGIEVTGTNIEKLKKKKQIELVGEDELLDISTSNPEVCSEEVCEDLDEPYSTEPEAEAKVEPVIPDIALSVNGKEYIVGEITSDVCCEIPTPFKCDPYQRRKKTVLQLTNIGRQTLTFTWQQGVYFYNRATLLLAMDNEFFFDTDNFRLTHGESRKVIVMYQPRKVSMSVELWRLQVSPRIFCANQESIQLRFHGRCTPPKEYLARLKELHCAVICKSNTDEMRKLLGLHSSLVPMIEPPPACCPFERTLDEREVFNSLNPGYNCVRFDDLEILKIMHHTLKKPREPHWDLRLNTIKKLIMRIEDIPEREKTFEDFTVLRSVLLGPSPSVVCKSLSDEQQQRTRYIYVRGVICNGIEEWEDMTFLLGVSFYKSELQHYLIKQAANDGEGGEEEEEHDVGDRQRSPPPAPPKIKVPISELGEEEDNEDAIHAIVLRSLKHSKYFRDTLYIQTYAHLCTIAENIVSVIESTGDVPN